MRIILCPWLEYQRTSDKNSDIGRTGPWSLLYHRGISANFSFFPHIIQVYPDNLKITIFYTKYAVYMRLGIKMPTPWLYNTVMAFYNLALHAYLVAKNFGPKKNPMLILLPDVIFKHCHIIGIVRARKHGVSHRGRQRPNCLDYSMVLLFTIFIFIYVYTYAYTC